MSGVLDRGVTSTAGRRGVRQGVGKRSRGAFRSGGVRRGAARSWGVARGAPESPGGSGSGAAEVARSAVCAGAWRARVWEDKATGICWLTDPICMTIEII